MARRTRKPVNMGGSLKKRAAKQFGKPKRGNLNQFAGKRPIITVQPVDWSGDEGQLAGFSLTAISEDGSPLTYQWQERVLGTIINLVDGVDGVTGAQTNSLTISSIDYEDDNREFRCKVSNTWTSTYSVWVRLYVTGVTWFLITETGSQMIDEPGLNDIVDERSP